MHYLFLIYGIESQMTPPKTPAEGAAMMAPWLDYTQALKGAGVYLGGNPLQPTSTATTVSQPAGKTEPVFTDGPFAETKEQLGGYYLVDCKNLDDALAWAAKCPGVRFGRVEVRPVASM
jgi:hypothetical protein